MRILMRNTVFKTAALAGLFSCVLMLAGAFSGITNPAHAIHADEVETEEQLKRFVQEAIDEYYIKTIIKTCDFSENPRITGALEVANIDLATATVEQIKGYIKLFDLVGLTSRSDIAPYCDFRQRFAEVFGRGDEDWNSGSIYLFVMDDTGEMLYHGANQDSEGKPVVAVDEAGQNVGKLILDGAETPPKKDGSIVRYCWDDPQNPDDDIAEADSDSTIAPGDSLKISYVVDPFEYYEAPALSASPGIIFGSGIYPTEMDSNLPQCDGNGMADGGGDMEPMDPEPMDPEPMDPEPMDPEPMDPEPMDPEEMLTSVSGGGCAIAAESDSTPRSDALNLLLIVSALLFTVSFGNRAVGRRNGS